MIRPIRWFLMLTKRLYKKISFLILLLLIPVCVVAFGVAAQQNSGFLHIVLAQEDPSDPDASRMIEKISQDNSMIRFTVLEDEKSAVQRVKNGKADEAWIFPANTKERIREFLLDEGEPVIRVYTKEQNVILRLSREKLSAALYESVAEICYIDYIRDNFPSLDHLSEEELMEYFYNASVDDDLFAFENASDVSSSRKENYLTSPVRGLLGILIALAGMAGTMYYMQDDKAGTFSRIRQNRKELVAFGCVATAVLNVAVVVTLSLFLLSLGGNVFKEIAILLLYTLCCTAFALLLQGIFSTLGTYSSLLPLVAVLFIGICPVFFDLKSMTVFQHLLPPTYFINAYYFDSYLLYLPIYTAACLVLRFLLLRARGRAFGKKDR